MSYFIVLEGLEGAGKTTAIDVVEDFLQQRTHAKPDIIRTREPGGTPLAEQLRQLLKSTNTTETMPDG